AVYAALGGDPRVFTLASYNKTGFDKSLNELRDKRLVTITGDQISHLELTRKGQTIEFGRSKENWQILKPRPLRADDSQVGELAPQLTEARMDISGTDEELKKVTAAFGQGAPVATAKVTGQAGEQELQVRKNKDTFYAKSSVVEGAYKVEASLGQALDKNLDDFRDKKIFDFGYDGPGKAELHAGPKAYFLNKGDVDWWSNGKKMDSASVQDFISKLRDLTSNKFAESGFANPTIQAIVTSSDGKQTEKVSIAKAGDHYLAQRENEPTLYQLDSTAIDALLK